VLLRKSESSKEYVRTVTLACMVLHNICIDQGDSLARKLDLTVDPNIIIIIIIIFPFLEL
jgi:hypothetical protein